MPEVLSSAAPPPAPAPKALAIGALALGTLAPGVPVPTPPAPPRRPTYDGRVLSPLVPVPAMGRVRLTPPEEQDENTSGLPKALRRYLEDFTAPALDDALSLKPGTVAAWAVGEEKAGQQEKLGSSDEDIEQLLARRVKRRLINTGQTPSPSGGRPSPSGSAKTEKALPRSPTLAEKLPKIDLSAASAATGGGAQMPLLSKSARNPRTARGGAGAGCSSAAGGGSGGGDSAEQWRRHIAARLGQQGGLRRLDSGWRSRLQGAPLTMR